MSGEILLVEDEKRSREATKGILEEEGFKVVTAVDKESALELFKKRCAHLSAAVIDLRLRRSRTDVSGSEVASTIKRMDPKIPTISLSAHSRKFPNFDFYFEKGSAVPAKRIEDNLDKIGSAIAEFESNKATLISTKLQEIKRKYLINDTDFQQLISLLPIPAVLEQALLAVHDATIGEAGGDHLDSNRHIRVIQTEHPKAHELGFRVPVPVIVEQNEQTAIAELYASPLVYAYGDSVTEALENLCESLAEYNLELAQEISDVNLSRDLTKFQSYLQSIFSHG
ncbi:response regulator [Sphingorhabdus sp. Alg231-15]|uniref:response regulator n=1 Tax=Sphingorhabdus sp. Alg231-15 TaxID=1922222 RepID=UPI000D5612D9